MKYGQIMYEWGVPLDEDQAYKISQWQKPKPGSGIISQIGAMQPAAVGGPQGAPQGVPVAGGAGPVDQPQMGAEQVPGQGQPVPYRRGRIISTKMKRRLPSRPVRLAV